VKIRRFFFAHLPDSAPATLSLDQETEHYVHDVLRLQEGSEIELFDGRGKTARGQLQASATVSIHQLEKKPAPRDFILAAPLLKGERLAWFVEKIAELGVTRFIPLITKRSLINTFSPQKHQRCERLAIAAARQSEQTEVMKIESPVVLADFQGEGLLILLDTQASISLTALKKSQLISSPITLLIGPEGDFTHDEKMLLMQKGAQPYRLGASILRVETAALSAVAVTAAMIYEYETT